jgi:hypothetical protein
MIGEQVFDAAGQRWTLFLGNAAQCAVEAHYDKGFFAVVSDAMPHVDAQTAMAVAQAMSAGTDLPADVADRAATAMRGMRLSVLRDLAYYGLQRRHPGTQLGVVSDIIDELGHERFGEIIGAAIAAAQGKRDDGEGGGDAAPGKSATRASGRTGKRSSSNGRRST